MMAPQAHYNLNGRGLVGSSLHDLNTIDSRNGDIEAIADTDRDAPTGDELDNDDDSTSAGDIGQQGYDHLSLQGVDGQIPEQSMPLGNDGSRSLYGALSINDVIPIESTRARFLQLIIDYFITYHVIPVSEAPEANAYSPLDKDKLKKRKLREVQYEGDPRFLLPLTFVANLYETLIREINQRLATVDGLHEKTFGVALEAAGGLYRRLVKKYPKSGFMESFGVLPRYYVVTFTMAKTPFPSSLYLSLHSNVILYGTESEESIQASNCFPTSPNTCRVGTGAYGNMTFKRREMASALEARTKFPQLVTGEEKRVRFVVVHGLELVERPNLPPEDAEWFKRLTGRHEAHVYESDYKFFAARVKQRRNPQHSLSTMAVLQPFQGNEPPTNLPSPTLRQQAFETHSVDCQPYSTQDPGNLHVHAQQLQHEQHPSHLQHTQHNPHTGHTHSHLSGDLESQGMHNTIVVVQQPTGPSKFCDECGSAYLRETSKFCSECGTKRLGM